jgi:protein-S-isoprenylcysteine O-methyltransferase Ste14
MLTCVLALLLSEAMVLHSTPILIWCVSFFVINNIYFVLVEEPGLEKRFGEEYSEYKRNVPR